MKSYTIAFPNNNESPQRGARKKMHIIMITDIVTKLEADEFVFSISLWQCRSYRLLHAALSLKWLQKLQYAKYNLALTIKNFLKKQHADFVTSTFQNWTQSLLWHLNRVNEGKENFLLLIMNELDIVVLQAHECPSWWLLWISLHMRKVAAVLYTNMFRFMLVISWVLGVWSVNRWQLDHNFVGRYCYTFSHRDFIYNMVHQQRNDGQQVSLHQLWNVRFHNIQQHKVKIQTIDSINHY